jgi:hypothetical protein
MLEIAAFTGALSSLGALIKVANESKNVEMTGKLIELQQKILGMQGDFGEMQQKVFELQQQNRELTESVARKNQYEHRFNAIWRKDDSGKYLGPFCPVCIANDKEVPLKPRGTDLPAGPVIGMTCQIFHSDCGNAIPISYVIPKDSLPEGWFYFRNQ